jgi:hypothetical protein
MKRTRHDLMLERAQETARVFKTICDTLNVDVDKNDVFTLMNKVDMSSVTEPVDEDTLSTDVPTVTPSDEEHKEGFVVYVLQLENGKYYVGRSESDEGVDSRIDIHKQSAGSAWTSKHKFVKEISRKRNCSAYQEDLVTVQMMQKYGLANVRGGSYCNDTLQNYQERCIKDQICTATGCCFKCLKTGHFAKDCAIK